MDSSYAVMWVGFAAYLAALAAAPRLGPRVVWASIAVALTVFAVVPPLLSHDVYSYIDYARLGVVHGLNPYVNPPLAARGDPVFAEVDWRTTTSVYGPLFTLASYPLALLPVNTALAILKGAAALAVLGLAALVARLAPARGVDRLRAAGFVALNPLVLVHVVGGAHNDGFAMLAAMAGAGAVLALRAEAGGAAFAAACLIKASAVVTAPFALLGAARDRRRADHGEVSSGAARFLLGAALAIVVIAAAGVAAFGSHWLGALAVAGARRGWTSHLSVPSTIARLTGADAAAVRAAALALLAGLAVYLLVWVWRGGDWLRAAGWASLGLLVASAWLLPWYLIWVLPLAALSRDRPLQVGVLALTAFQLAARLPA